MIARCTNPNLDYYHNYGGRGISVCERWRDFANFHADMGERPLNTSLDRIDNNGNYEPGNCRWATRSEQLLNTRRNHRVTALGRTQTVTEWGHELNILPITISTRLKRGWSVGEALNLSGRIKTRRHNSNTHLVTYGGKTMTVTEWSRKIPMAVKLFSDGRRKYGLTDVQIIERAMARLERRAL
jgi:hypothetical protein